MWPPATCRRWPEGHRRASPCPSQTCGWQLPPFLAGEGWAVSFPRARPSFDQLQGSTGGPAVCQKLPPGLPQGSSTEEPVRSRNSCEAQPRRWALEGEESWALSQGCAWLPAPYPQLTTPQGKRGSATDPRGAVDTRVPPGISPSSPSLPPSITHSHPSSPPHILLCPVFFLCSLP